MRTNERGVALAMVIVMALLFAVAAFGVMTLATSRSQTSGLQAHRLKAQYAAEAALVQAMQRLWANPNYPANPPVACPTPPCPGLCIDGSCPSCDVPGSDLTDAVTIAGTSVGITVTNCGAGRTHALKARVASY